MQMTLDDRLSGSLGQVLGMQHGSDELAVARTDRKHLASTLLKSLLRSSAGGPLLSPADLYKVVPRRTWIRRKAEGGLTPSEFDGLYRMVRLQLLADLVFQDRQRAHDWLHAPKSRLGGSSPMDFATDSLGFEAVESWLHEIDQGFFA